jgi:hypothetical protein
MGADADSKRARREAAQAQRVRMVQDTWKNAVHSESSNALTIMRGVRSTFPLWVQRVQQVLSPTAAKCVANNSQEAGPPEPLSLCPSVSLQLVYQLMSKAGSSFVRSTLHERYDSPYVITCETSPTLTRARFENGTRDGWAWFTFVRDPLERFLSAVSEVSYRRMAHPAVMLNGAGRWTPTRTYNATAHRVKGNALPPGDYAKGREGDLRHYWPKRPRDRLDMVETLVTRLKWRDVHFRSQWSSVVETSRLAPQLMYRGFIGDVCNISDFFKLIRAGEANDTRAMRDAHAEDVHQRDKNFKVIANQRRFRLSTDAEHRANPYPDTAQTRRIKAHYALDYECLQMPAEGGAACHL